MKKVSLLALAASLATPAVADVCPKGFQGFHLGGNIGYGVGTANKTGTLTNSETDSSFSGESTTFSNRLGFKGVDGGIGTGYTHRFGNWGLGIAFDANWANTKGRFTTTGVADSEESQTVKGNARLKNSLQLYARAGYVIGNQAMPFVALGWDNSKWAHKTSISRTITSDSPSTTTISANKSKRLNALMWKLGVDFLATKHVVVGFEYTGTSAGKINSKTTNADGDVLKSSFKTPQYNKFALTAKVVY